MGPVGEHLGADHARLDALMRRAGRDPAAYDAFREGLLRHIGVEERVLLPALARHGKAPTALTERLRLDHGALTNLLVPHPTPPILRAMRAVLEPHNALEEGAAGFYADCDALPAAERDAVVAAMKAAPELPLRPCSDRPEAFEAAKRALARAGYDWATVSAAPPGPA